MQFVLLFISLGFCFYHRRTLIDDLQSLKTINLHPIYTPVEIKSVPKYRFSELEKFTEQYFKNTHFGSLEAARKYFDTE